MNRRRSFSSRSMAAALALAALSILASCQIHFAIPAAPANRYALLVGVEDYPGGSTHDLSYPADDVVDMKAALEAKGWTVRTLVNGQATKAAISAGIGALSADPDATILVYYSGHGSDLTETASLIPHDGILSPYTYDTTAWISPADMSGWMAAVPARHRVLILDSCYSGGFSLGAGAVDTSPADYSRANGSTSDTLLLNAAISRFSALVQENLARFGSPEILTLAAAGSEEESYDDNSHLNGAFTYYLVEAASSGDYDGDGFVTVDEAYRYAKARILAVWNTDRSHLLYDEDFLPHISGGTGDLVLY